jgi:alpha-maltose-1-phosphate synthase
MAVAVDFEAAAWAFERLFVSPELRTRMGRAGALRARQLYDWGTIIPRYEALWSDLLDLRKRAAPSPHLPASWPARMDPFAAFASYPSHLMTVQTQFALADSDVEQSCARVTQYRALAMVDFADAVLPTDGEVRHILQSCRAGPVSATALVEGIIPERRAIAYRGLAFLTKAGVLKALV